MLMGMRTILQTRAPAATILIRLMVGGVFLAGAERVRSAVMIAGRAVCPEAEEIC
jgi:hypothetical protein